MIRWTARCRAFRRASRGWPAAVLMTPASRTTTPPAPASSTPNPVATRPGSTPMTRSALGRGDGVDDLVGDVVVGIHGLDVVLLLEGLDQPQHRRGLLTLYLHGGLRHHVHPRFDHRHPLPLERLADRLHFIRTRGDFEHFFYLLDVGRPRVERFLEQIVLLDLLGVHLDHPAAVEHPGHAARSPHPPLVLLEDVPNLGSGAVLVV